MRRAALNAACTLLLSLALLICAATAMAASSKTVRVGWFESPFNTTGPGGERSGYAYEYQQAIAAYTGWTYEYVTGEWDQLLDMLVAGEIDLLADVSHRPGREDQMLFSIQPMGQEKYYIYANLASSIVTMSDLSTLEGTRIGVFYDSLLLDMFNAWAEQNGVSAQAVLLEGTSGVTDMLKSGELNGIVSSEATEKNNPSLSRIVCIGSSEIYFAINPRRPDLKDELDIAMRRILELNPYYNEELHSRHMSSSTRAALSEEELDWLHGHGPIRVAFLKNNLAFSDIDEETGELIGALAEYIRFAGDCLDNASLTFEPVPCASQKEELEALRDGRVDMIFPMNRSLYHGETMGLLFSDPVLETPMAAVTTQNQFNESSGNRVAVYAGNTGVKWYLASNYPDWTVVDCKPPMPLEEALYAGEADCFITSAYRLNNYHNVKSLYCVYLSQTGSMSFATRRDDTALMSILNKTILVMPKSLMNGALTMYANPVQRVTLIDLLQEYAVPVSIAGATVLTVILLIILHFLHQAKKAESAALLAEKNTSLLNEQLQKSHADLRLALASAEHANASKTTFLNNMSHDIRTPMNAIIGFTALAASHIDNPEAVRDYLSKISTSSNHLLSLINDVLDMSRIESGKVVIEQNTVHLPDIFRDLRIIAQPNVTAKQLDFFIDTQDIVTEDIISDKLRLNQVLLNIISNAIKFTPAGGTISIRIIERPDPRSGYTCFEFRIKDTGIGMSPEFQSHIFEAFSREHSSTVSGIQGTGLGMAITKNIVDMLGGSITVSSEEGKGTEFVVTLPCRIAGTQVPTGPIPELQGSRALVVDDNADTCMSVSKMLREIGMRPDWTTTGRESVLRTRESLEQGDPFSVFIADWMMPDMNGIETVRRIRQVIGTQTPIIILTAYDWTDIESEARAAGVTAFISKPLFMSDLRDVLTGSLAPTETQALPLPQELAGKRVLLVEDNELNQEIAVEILQGAGLVLDVASDGIQALEKVQAAGTDSYDVILMDVQMPRMDGYEATRRIRALADPAKAGIPIIAMTANAFDEDRRAAFAAGMNGFVLKPIDISKLMALLRQQLQ